VVAAKARLLAELCGGAAKESQKAKGKTQKSKVKSRTSTTYGEQATEVER
jgi:hypothetical protein